MMDPRSCAGLLTLLCILSLVLQTTPSSPDDIQYLPACAQSTCANYVLTCYDAGQASFEDCVNMTQADVYTCALQKCSSCVDFAGVENWVYVYGTENLVTSLWPSISNCTSTSTVTETESSAISLSSPTSQSSILPTSPQSSSQSSHQTSRSTTETDSITSPIAPSVVTSTIFVSLSITPTQNTTPSMSASTTNVPAFTTPVPSSHSSGLSKNAKVGIGVGTGVGGVGLLSLVIALSMTILKKKGKSDTAPPAEQPRSAPQIGQNPTLSDKPEMPADPARIRPPRVYSELEGSPVQPRQPRNGADVRTSPQTQGERAELPSRSMISELHSMGLEGDGRAS
ncbi:hypothetical protein PV11_06803 [Exophiala sideris]|uniref:Extracellular membrane protein CFEM domain-containing protein n=1 Tax=Exophiala sideris TaxID=1016849 RepID=A0A0D1YWM9_9EURO|nr:hypothetical protein PV11_06803 [Exophiala sideris]